jgi:hypothetical protein
MISDVLIEVPGRPTFSFPIRPRGPAEPKELGLSHAALLLGPRTAGLGVSAGALRLDPGLAGRTKAESEGFSTRATDAAADLKRSNRALGGSANARRAPAVRAF